MGRGIIVPAYHSVAPGAKLDKAIFEEHLSVLKKSGLPSLLPEELEGAAGGFLLTFDDGFVDFWTHALPLLEKYEIKATLFAITSRAGDGPQRAQGAVAYGGGGGEALREGACSGEANDGFMRWEELRAAEATGLVRVLSHSHKHDMAWRSDRITGFHLPPEKPCHWSLPQLSGGDTRPGIPLYERRGALACNRFSDEKAYRDRFAGWLEERGGAGYVREKGSEAVSRELSAFAAGLGAPEGVFESDSEREARVIDDLKTSRSLMESRLGGERTELCLPWGHYDELTLKCAEAAGVTRVYTLDRGPNPAGRIGFTVNRFEPRPRSGGWLKSRLWIYGSCLRAGLYGSLASRRSQ